MNASNARIPIFYLSAPVPENRCKLYQVFLLHLLKWFFSFTNVCEVTLSITVVNNLLVNITPIENIKVCLQIIQWVYSISIYFWFT